MRIDETILQALKRAVAEAGDAKELAARCQVSASNISRYLSGKVQAVSDDNWGKIRKFLCPGSLEQDMQNTPVLEWKELQQDPELKWRN